MLSIAYHPCTAKSQSCCVSFSRPSDTCDLLSGFPEHIDPRAKSPITYSEVPFSETCSAGYVKGQSYAIFVTFKTDIVSGLAQQLLSITHVPSSTVHMSATISADSITFSYQNGESFEVMTSAANGEYHTLVMVHDAATGTVTAYVDSCDAHSSKSVSASNFAFDTNTHYTVGYSVVSTPALPFQVSKTVTL